MWGCGVKSKDTLQIVDEKSTFEVGGRGKTNKQIKNVSDDIEIGADNKIPLWLFGFLY